jgi:hypothetical protein
MNNPHQGARLTVCSREQIVARVLLTGAAIAATLGLARSTVARWLEWAGVGHLARLDPPAPVRRYQRARPGELIHLDIRKLGRFDQPVRWPPFPSTSSCRERTEDGCFQGVERSAARGG